MRTHNLYYYADMRLKCGYSASVILSGPLLFAYAARLIFSWYSSFLKAFWHQVSIVYI